MALTTPGQTVGDIVSGAIRRFRQNYQFYFRTLTVPAILTSCSTSLIFWSVNKATDRTKIGDGHTPISILATLALIGFLALMVGQFLWSVRFLAIIRMHLLSQQSYVDAFKFVNARRWKAFALTLLTGICSFTPFCIGLILGVGIYIVSKVLKIQPLLCAPILVLDAALVFIATSWIGIFSNFLYSVFACNAFEFRKLFRRAMKLTAPNVWRGSFYVSFSFFVVVLIYQGCDFPYAISSVIRIICHKFEGSPAQIALSSNLVSSAMQVSDQLWGILAQIFSSAFSAIGAALFCRDSVARLEGTDMLESIEQRVNENESENTSV